MNDLNSVYILNANAAYAVGDWGTILKTTNVGLGIIEKNISQESKYTIYPNPATDKITITHHDELINEAAVSIFNINGEMILNNMIQNQNKFEMNISSLSKGIYFVKIQTKSEIESKKLVIQ